MKLKTQYIVSEEISLVNETEQLSLFEKNSEMNDVELKYPRRKSRTIANNTFKLEAPTEVVSQTMRTILSSDTKIEQLLEKELQKAKLNYCRPALIIEQIPGKPDFIIPRYRIAIFCDGDFWHGKNYEKGSIKNNTDFWDAKIERNILRDEEVNYGLQNNNWQVFRFWESDIKKNPANCISKILNYLKTHFKKVQPKFTFVDLFSGIGGFRIPLEQLGGQCLGFSEIDKKATEVYKRNFLRFKDDEEIELGDITKLGKLPFENIDLIVGGVPCQAWSVAGKMKGFDDPRGKLWNDTIRVVKENQPKAFIFENVKGLIDPRNRSSLNLIIKKFQGAGYVVKEPHLLNSYDFGLPQNRDRIFIVGVRKDLCGYFEEFEYPKPINKKSFLKDLIDDVDKDSVIDKKIFDPKDLFGDKIPMSRNRFQKLTELNDFFIFCDTRNGHTTIHSWDIIRTSQREKDICMTILRNRRKKIYGNSDGNPLSYNTLKKLIPDLKKMELEKLVDKNILRRVNTIGYEFVNSKNSSGINNIYRVYLPHSNIFSTLTATGSKDIVALKDIMGNTTDEYRANFINEIIKKKLFRPITAREAGKLQGFPKWFSFHKDEKIAKKQFGNAVSTSVIFYLAKEILGTRIFENTIKLRYK